MDPVKCVELEVLFKRGSCAGIRNGVKERVSPSDMDFATEAMRTCGTSSAAVAEDATKREFNYLYHEQYMLMCFIGKMVAKMSSYFLLEALMEVLKDSELQMAMEGVGSTGFVA